ncbi:glycosyltransferase family 4 protein [Propionivibrio sp.]|uniref:glycosyltransferase family 4 protein n=1 Tax=Propionivibrio sp. TaxID=2212460 RepID=UPI003BF14E81
MPRLDLAIVTETYPPEVNGVAMTIGRLVEGLRKNGHRVRLVRPRQNAIDAPVIPKDSCRENDLVLPGFPLPGYAGLRFGLPAKRRLCAAWREHRPDAVHVVTEGPLGWSAVAAARSLGIPVTSGFHTNFDRYSRHYGMGWLQPTVAAYLRSFHRRTRATLVPTDTLAASLAGEGLSGVRVVGRGVDVELFDPARRSNALRAEWGLAGADLAVLYVGRVAAEKNIGLALRAFTAIQVHRPGARFILVGDGPLRAKMQQQFPAHHFAGQRLGCDLATHYASADIFLFPSLTETFGNVTQEAMASALTVVAFRSAAAAQMIVDGENGRTITPGDDLAFIQAAALVAQDGQALRKLGERARQSVGACTWGAVSLRFEAVLREAINVAA